MITEKSYLETKKLIADYESEQLNIPAVSGWRLFGDEKPLDGKNTISYLEYKDNNKYINSKKNGKN